jgi:hypothetical protein
MGIKIFLQMGLDGKLLICLPGVISTGFARGKVSRAG